MKLLKILLIAVATLSFFLCGPIEPYEPALPTDQSIIIKEIVEIDSINEKPELSLNPCETMGGFAYESGLKIWCWQDIKIVPGGPRNYEFSNNQLAVGTECVTDQILNVGNQLKFELDLSKQAADWCKNDFNLRAEISTSPWLVKHPLGTEEWFGWTYTFADNYVIDKKNPWAFFQEHEGTTGEAPLISLWVMNEGGPGSGKAGEIHVVNATGNLSSYAPTEVIPQAGELLNIVLHVVWGDESNGWLQVWINQKKVYDVHEATVRDSNPFGGNAKFGIYKWAWRDKTGVDNSIEQGITKLETFMGPLRIVTRLADDPDFGKVAYDLVAPN